MENRGFLGKATDFYLAHPCLVGSLYGIIPVLLWFAWMFLALPFRDVYLMRMLLSLFLAGACGGYLNRFGLGLWLAKHRSAQGPGTVIDGMLIGAAIGMGTALFAPLTSLIKTNHLEEAKWFIIAAWLAAALIGLACGGIVTLLGKRHISRDGK